MSNVPPIFVINLARSIERRAHMSKMLDALDLKYEFIEAIDGKQLTDDQINEVYDERMAVKYGGSPLQVEAIATYMSHIKALQTIIDRNIPEALILEDDIIVSPDIKPFFEQRNKLPRDYGILSLSIRNDHEQDIFCWYRKSWKIYKDYIVGLPSGWLCGSYAYLVQDFYIREFMQCMYPIVCQYDSQCFNNNNSHDIYYAFKNKSIIEAKEIFPSERLSGENKHTGIRDKSISQIKYMQKIPSKPGIFNVMFYQLKQIIFSIIAYSLVYWFLPKRFPNRILRPYKTPHKSRKAILNYLYNVHVK